MLDIILSSPQFFQSICIFGDETQQLSCYQMFKLKYWISFGFRSDFQDPK